MERSKVITDPDDLLDLKGPWEELRHRCGGSIFSSYTLSMAWLEAFKDIVEPRVLVVEEEGEVVGIAPMALKRQRFSGVPVKLLSMIGDADRKMSLNPLRFLVEPERKDVLDQMVRSIKKVDWNIMRMNFMDDVQNTDRFMSVARSKWDVTSERRSVAVTCSLPKDGNIEDAYKSEERRKVRQALRKAERETHLELRTPNVENVKKAIGTYAEQHIQRWSSKGGSIYLDPANVAFLITAIHSAFLEGFGWGYELLINDRVAAQQFGFVENQDMVWAYILGMNNDYAHYRPGMLLELLVMTDLKDKGYTSVNMGDGADVYKYRLGGKETYTQGLEVRRGLASWVSRASNNTMIKRIDSRLGILGRFSGGRATFEASTEGTAISNLSTKGNEIGRDIMLQTDRLSLVKKE